MNMHVNAQIHIHLGKKHVVEHTSQDINIMQTILFFQVYTLAFGTGCDTDVLKAMADMAPEGKLLQAVSAT